MLYCNTATVVATRRAGAGLGARALGRACKRWAGAQAGAAGGRTLGERGMSGRHAGGDTAMLACDTAEGPAATGA